MSQWIRVKIRIIDDLELTERDARQFVEDYRDELMKFLPVEDVEFEEWKPKEEVPR